jgi:beta-alanine degradation protein BauB
MKAPHLTKYGISFTALLLTVGAGAQNQDSSGTTVKIPSSQIHYVSSGIKQNGGEIFFGPAYGDLKTGRHGTFLKFTPGFRSLLHSHTYDYFAVVVQGVMANPEKGEKDVPLPPGSYWYQKGGEAHSTKCLSKDKECIIFLVSDGKFDAQVLEKEQGHGA